MERISTEPVARTDVRSRNNVCDQDECTDDAIAPRSVGEYIHRSVRGSELVTLDAVGHCPHLSAHDATIAAIERFVGRT